MRMADDGGLWPIVHHASLNAYPCFAPPYRSTIILQGRAGKSATLQSDYGMSVRHSVC